MQIIDRATGTIWHITTNSEVYTRTMHNIGELCGSNKDSIVEKENDRLGKDGKYRLNSDKIRSEQLEEDKSRGWLKRSYSLDKKQYGCNKVCRGTIYIENKVKL